MTPIDSMNSIIQDSDVLIRTVGSLLQDQSSSGRMPLLVSVIIHTSQRK